MTIFIEDGIEGIEETESLTKDEFFNILEKEPEGLVLTVDKVNKPFNSKFQDAKREMYSERKKKALYLWYTFEVEGSTKKVELAYNLDYEVEPNSNTFKLVKNSLLFKLLALTTPNINGLSGVTINYSKLVEKLTGIKFKAVSELIKGKNNTYSYILKPVSLI